MSNQKEQISPSEIALNPKIKMVEVFARETMSNSELAHDFSHVDRVRRHGLEIATQEGYENLELVEIAALLHDVGLCKQEERKNHGTEGAEMARKFLSDALQMPTDEIEEIVDAIKSHNTRAEGNTKLAEILRDGDIIDMLGAIGIMRAYTSKHNLPEYNLGCIKGETWGLTADDFDGRFASGVGIGPTIVDQINFQISCFDNLRTDAARKIAVPLVEFMRNFILELEREAKS